MEIEFHKDYTDKHGRTYKAGRRAHVTGAFAKAAEAHCTIVGSESNRHTMDRTSLIETGMAPNRQRLESDEATDEENTKTKTQT